MNKSPKLKIVLLAAIALIIVTTGFRCKWITPQQKELLKPIELNWWGVADDPDNFSELINDYRQLHPNISIKYRKLRAEEFETELINALAEDRGPDIISLKNTWLTKYLSKIEPLPAKTTLAYEVTKTSLGVKQETIVEVRETPSLTPAQLKTGFIDVVSSDVVRQDKIYGLPLSVETLVLFYNRDLLNNAGIPLPPNSWEELQAQVKKLTFQDQDGDLIQSGAALGRSDNVKNSTDIVSLLMIQNGSQMTSGRQITFAAIPPGFPDRTYNPGPKAVEFYTDFANPTKEVYTWDQTFPNSIDAFAAGQVALIFGYSDDIPILEMKRQGKLNYGIIGAPQIADRNEVNFASYWVQAVAKKSKNQNEAWDFIQFISKASEAKKYLAKTGKVTALRSLIEEQVANDELKIFAEQLLTSKIWYQGNDVQIMENAMKQMIEEVRSGNDLQKAVELAAQKVQQTL